MKRFAVLCLTLVMAFGLVACGGNSNDNGGGGDKPTDPAVVLDIPAVYEKLCQAAELPEMYKVEDDMLLDLYGIRAEDVKQILVYDCIDYLRADEIWLVEAANADAAATIKGLAESRVEALDTQSVTYSPEQNAVVKKAQLIQTGNYIALIISPDVEALAQAFRAEAGL